jgi:hypothetical protein
MENKKRIVLNLGSGAIDMSDSRYADNDIIIHLDGCYRDDSSYNASDIENMWIHGELFDCPVSGCQHLLCSCSIFEFVERFPFKFDTVYADRIFEHMEYAGGEIGRLLEGLNRITTDESTMEIIVPNAILLAEKLIAWEENGDTYDATDSLNDKLIINTEFCNVKQDCHASVWSPHLARDYINSEGTWHVDEVEKQIKFAHRDIYMRIECAKQNINNK